MSPPRSAGCAALSIVLAAVCAGCSVSPVNGTPSPAPSTSVTSGSVSLDGWQLTLPLPGKHGTAAIVNPAAAAPPWFSNGRHTLTASITVSQVPAETDDVIIGQIHGADTIKSVPFVMLHYHAGAITVVVKQQQSGPAAQELTLLSDVALNSRFDYSLTDNGDGSLTFAADDGPRHASLNAPLPDAFRGATVRFQAGAYQQGKAGHGAAAGDGARLTFSALTRAE